MTIHPVQGNPILESLELTWPWQGIDPFLVCGHHVEHYPAGNAELGVPEDKLQGHKAGNDFANPDGFSTYFGAHGIPGFPNHPHRGMETVSILRKGYVDHADSLGNCGRYGPGDVQWMTAGAGLQHAEMFPLLHDDQPNDFDLLQIWLNMPARSKLVQPEYKMMWSEHIAHYRHAGADVAVIAGAYQPQGAGVDASLVQPIAPTRSTWASQPEAELAIWMIELQPGAKLILPAAQLQANQRTLFVFEGSSLLVAGQDVGGNRRVRVVAQQTLALENRGTNVVCVMLMQGVPIAEPVIRSTVYVTNTIEELHQAKRDFQRTQFGGWPWDTRQPLHGPGFKRFAKYVDETVVDEPN